MAAANTPVEAMAIEIVCMSTIADKCQSPITEVYFGSAIAFVHNRGWLDRNSMHTQFSLLDSLIHSL
jgi:hypothetical protein